MKSLAISLSSAGMKTVELVAGIGNQRCSLANIIGRYEYRSSCRLTEFNPLALFIICVNRYVQYQLPPRPARPSPLSSLSMVALP